MGHGEQGEVMGPSWDGDTRREGMLLIKFPNIKVNGGTINCPLSQLSRSPPPPLPGGSNDD